MFKYCLENYVPRKKREKLYYMLVSYMIQEQTKYACTSVCTSHAVAITSKMT